EYAVTDGFGTNGHLRAALGEAVYMQGLENNSDICVMASYAPIFYHEERGGGWLPDMIRFNHEASFGTPSYYVQKLMPQFLGKQNVKWTEEGNLVGGGENKIGLSSWSTTVSYDNIKVTDLDGKTLVQEDFSGDASNWDLPSTAWSIQEGQLSQSNGSEQGRIAFCNTVLPSSYVLELDATKKSGAEGFLVAVNLADRDNYIWWNIGGWNNGQHGIQVCTNGAKSDYDLKSGNIEIGRSYHIRMEVGGTRVKCYLDGELIHDLNLPAERKVYVSSSIDDENKVMYVKLVNTRDEASEVVLNMANARILTADLDLLTSASDTDENTMENPYKVAPVSANSINAEGNAIKYEAPAYSLSILTIQLDDIEYTPPTMKHATEEQWKQLEKDLEPVIKKLAWLHQSCSLPVLTSSGIEIRWEIPDAGVPLSVAIEGNRHSAQLKIKKPNTSDKTMLICDIAAIARFTDGAECLLSIPVSLAPADNWHGYLYTYMNSGKEITNMAIGSKEGLGKKFEQLLDGEEIFNTAELASIEGGTRDAYLGRGEKEHEYFMTTTDMCNAKSGKWNNYGIDLLRSNDLVHWESSVFDFRKGKSIFSDSEAATDCYKTDEEYSKIDRVWAPQFIWDASADNGEGAYLVYYSLLSSNEWDRYDRLYYSYADKDFKTLTQPRLLMDPGVSLIDADIVFNEYDGLYHMLVKRSGTGAATTGIYEYTSTVLTGGEWKEVGRMENQNTTQVEAPTQIRRIGEDVYNMYFMRFDNEYSYKVADMDHDGLKAGLPVRVAGTGAFQHGSVIYIDKEEFDMLQIYSDVKGLLRQAKAAQATTSAFDEAIDYTDKVIAECRTVSSLLENLPAAYDMLVDATGKYLAEGERLENGYIDITRLLQNPNFDMDNSSGWSGTSFTAVSHNVAEHFSRVFDTYQVLKAMPAGSYRLEAQVFYRYGLPAFARPAHNDGTEDILASLYINDSARPVMSLYDEEYSKYPDNMYEASVAFNNDHKYTDNSVELIMPEAGDIRAGIRKLEMVDGDWTIFDNFRLYYKPELTSVSEMEMDPEAIVNVYSADGTVVRTHVKAADATIGLGKGIYIVGDRKVVVK
ncbi:MAG: hypothetical protein K2I92_06425, partial [Muribaculaceae bacterium]|nr:hypothetical protein [Muribaculaceae bacterium]